MRDHLAAAGIVAAIATAGMAGLGRPLVDRPSRHVLLALMTSGIALLAYYSLFSFSFCFYERYFVPIKLLMVILLALVLVRALNWVGNRLVANGLALVVATIAVSSNVSWIAHDFGLPSSGHFGEESHDIVRSPYATDGSRLGLMESGRFGFLYPTRVVNLDGEVNAEALHALKNNALDEYLRKANLDYIMLPDFDVAFFDERLPAWRDMYAPAGNFHSLDIFAKRAPAR